MSSKNDDHKGGYSREGLFGEINHYDEHGHKVGESRPSFWGGYDDYDEKGHKTGYSSESLFGAGYEHYDNKGNKTGYSSEDFLGGYTHHDAAGHVTGHSDRSVMDIKSEEEIRATGSLYGTSWSSGTTKAGPNKAAQNNQAGMNPDAMDALLITKSGSGSNIIFFCIVMELIGHILIVAGAFLPCYLVRLPDDSTYYTFSLGNLIDINLSLGIGIVVVCLLSIGAIICFLIVKKQLVKRDAITVFALGLITVIILFIWFLGDVLSGAFINTGGYLQPGIGYFMLLISSIILGFFSIFPLVLLLRKKKAQEQ